MDSLEEIERAATLNTSSDLARYLQDHLGQQLSAYVTGLNDPKMVGRWASGSVRPRFRAQLRLRTAYHVTRILVEAFDDQAAQGWMVSTKSALDEEAPGWVLRHAADPGALRLLVPLAKEFAEGDLGGGS